MDKIDENAIVHRADNKAEQFFSNPKYKPFIESLEKDSALSKVRSITSYDVYALGHQLHQFENYVQMCEEDGTVNQLGKIPNVALDVITVAYGSSPLSVAASVQPVEEEQGTIYYKDVVAQTTRGGVTTGDVMSTPNQMDQNIYDGYSGDIATQTLDTTVALTLTYGGVVTNAPLRKERVIVTVPSLGLTATDNGNGFLIGYNLQGTIDYATGAITVEFATNPGVGAAIVVQSAQDFEGAPDIPKIVFQLKSKSIMSRIWALKSTVGLEQSYAFETSFWFNCRGRSCGRYRFSYQL